MWSTCWVSFFLYTVTVLILSQVSSNPAQVSSRYVLGLDADDIYKYKAFMAIWIHRCSSIPPDKVLQFYAVGLWLEGVWVPTNITGCLRKQTGQTWPVLPPCHVDSPLPQRNRWIFEVMIARAAAAA